MKFNFKKILSFFLAFVLLCSISISAFATQPNKKTLKVGFYPLAGFFEYNENGTEIGYGVEVLNEISKYTNYNFEYVYMDAWEKNGPAVLSGEIDLFMPVSRPNSPVPNYSWTDQGIIDTYYCLMTLKNRDDLLYQDYKNFKNLKISITKGFENFIDVFEHLYSVGISKDNIIWSESFFESVSQVKNGEADVIFTNIMDYESEKYKIIDRFYTETNVIVSRDNESFIYNINEAISKIKLNKPNFFSELYKKYFPERASSPLSVSETKALENSKGICFAFADDRGFISDFINGEAVGIMPEIAKKSPKI